MNVTTHGDLVKRIVEHCNSRCKPRQSILHLELRALPSTVLESLSPIIAKVINETCAPIAATNWVHLSTLAQQYHSSAAPMCARDPFHITLFS